MNFKVLVTRPLPVATELCELIVAMGAEATCCPVFNIHELALEIEPRQFIKYQHFIFLSMPAVKAATKLVRRLLDLKVPATFWAIGPATKKKMLELNIPDVNEPDVPSSEGLLVCLKKQLDKKQKIAIFCGQHGRDLLFKTLKELGHQVDNIYLYQREPVDNLLQSIREFIQQSQDNKRLVVVSTSIFSLQLLIAEIQSLSFLEQKCFFTAHLVVVSARMLMFARKQWFNQKIVIAQGMSNQAIVNTLWSLANE